MEGQKTVLRKRVGFFSFFTIGHFRRILLLSLLLAAALPAYNVLHIYPSLERQMIHNTANGAIRVARHLSSKLVAHQRLIAHDHAAIKELVNMEELVDLFGLLKIKLISDKGEVIYSTNLEEIGKTENDNLFFPVVSQGNVYTENTKKITSFSPGQQLEADVVKTYIPIHRDGNFIGVFEVQCDVTKRMGALKNLHTRSVTVLTGLVLTLLLIIVSVMKDHGDTINRRKEAIETAKEKLKQKRLDIRSLALAIDQSPVSIVITDIKGDIQYVNPKFCQTTGYTFDEAVGQNPRILNSGLHGAEVYKDLWETIASGNQWSGEFQNRRKDGILLWERVHISPVSNSDGEIVNYIALKEDITLQKEIEEALRDSAKQHRTIMETCADPIIVYDYQGRVVSINKAFTRVFGWSSEEILGKRLDFVPDEAVVETQKNIQRVLKGESITGIETRRIRKDGVPIDVCLGAALLHDANWKSVGIVVNFQDITKQKQIQAELEKAKLEAETANRSKSEFLANMSHEIRTPMNGVIGMADMLMDTDLSESQRELLEITRRSADHLMAIINDILDLSKIEAGRIDFEEIDFSLFATVEDTAEILSLKAQEKGLELVCHIDFSIPVYLQGDPGRLKQILLNLGGNAVKFTEKGEVAIHCKLEETLNERVILHFEVSDTGIGIPEDKIETIFDSFQQADGSTTRKYGGTGLGLTISRQLTELMGGEIWVESPSASGKGSAFHFTVELKVKPDQKPPIWHHSTKGFQGKRVLIVDDNRTNRLVLQEMVSSWGFTCEKVVDGHKALEMMVLSRENHSPFDLVLTDMQMPGMSGFELAEKVKQKGFVHIPLVVLTSAGMKGDAKRAQELGIDGYLVKPIKKAALFQVLSMVMAKNGGVDSKQRQVLVTRHSIRENNHHQRCRILLTEDDAVSRKLAVMLLEKHHHLVTVAVNGAQAVDHYKKEPFDIVLMDLQMPVMGGIEATKRIREIEKEKGIRTPVIAMTAHALRGDREKALTAGMDDYITKPIEAGKVMAAIAKWADNSSAGQRLEQTGQKRLSSDTPPIDVDKALVRTMGDRNFLDELITTFAESLPDQMDGLRSAFEQGDAQTLAGAAHKIKGGAINLSAAAMASAALALEKAGRKNGLSDAAVLVEALDQEIERFGHFAGQLKTTGTSPLEGKCPEEI